MRKSLGANIMNNRKGFTLIELLVVISIIALLMSIMMPALSRVKNQAKDVLCMNNLRQWGVTTIAYSNENNNQMVAEQDIAIWVYELKPFLGMSERSNPDGKGDIMFCPRANKPREDNGEPGIGHGLGPLSAWGIWPGDGYKGGLGGSYAFNAWLYNVTIRDQDEGHMLKKSWKTFNVKHGFKVPLMGGSYGCAALPEAWDNPPAYQVGAEYLGLNLNNFCVNRHNGYINMVFLDGSVRNVGLKELWILSWHREFEKDWATRNARTSIDWPEWMENFKDYY